VYAASYTQRLGARAGLTLVELLVVLAILAALATVAVSSTTQLVDEGRYEATRSSLREFERAVLGSGDLVDANQQPWIRGFVADVGRLPRAVGVPGQMQGAELWSPKAFELSAQVQPLLAYGLQQPLGELGVILGAGWRGPYLELPLGESGWRDGWGRAFELRNSNGEPCTDGDPIARVRSLGADGAEGGVGYDADLSVVLWSTADPIVPPRHTGQVLVRVTGTEQLSLAAEQWLVAKLYGPAEGAVGTLAAASTKLVDLADEDGETQLGLDALLVLSAVPIGSRVLRLAVTANDPEVPVAQPLAGDVHIDPPRTVGPEVQGGAGP
jgi:prepilin-type N-terminal cleavage/methylation domain-containing protein